MSPRHRTSRPPASMPNMGGHRHGRRGRAHRTVRQHQGLAHHPGSRRAFHAPRPQRQRSFKRSLRCHLPVPYAAFHLPLRPLCERRVSRRPPELEPHHLLCHPGLCLPDTPAGDQRNAPGAPQAPAAVHIGALVSHRHGLVVSRHAPSRPSCPPLSGFWRASPYPWQAASSTCRTDCSP